jgi:hypothetical protein
MILWPSATMLTSNPPKQPMEWWCACGYRDPSDVTVTAASDPRLSIWSAVQSDRRWQQEREAEIARIAAEPTWKRLLRRIV